jgi:hypothetical protein
MPIVGTAVIAAFAWLTSGEMARSNFIRSTLKPC